MQLAPDDPSLETVEDLVDADVALWDLGWSGAGSLAQMQSFAELEIPILALLDEDEAAGQVWSGGAQGLLLRDTPAEALRAALTAVATGLVVVAPELAHALPVSRVAAEEALIVEELTARELEVLQLLAEGAPNKEIARRLVISENTVKYHVNAILGKLGAQSRTEAVVRATRAGLILL